MHRSREIARSIFDSDAVGLELMFMDTSYQGTSSDVPQRVTSMRLEPLIASFRLSAYSLQI
jgi:hypothetical protein